MGKGMSQEKYTANYHEMLDLARLGLAQILTRRKCKLKGDYIFVHRSKNKRLLSGVETMLNMYTLGSSNFTFRNLCIKIYMYIYECILKH